MISCLLGPRGRKVLQTCINQSANDGADLGPDMQSAPPILHLLLSPTTPSVEDLVDSGHLSMGTWTILG